jgi:hypothetical protein
VHADHRIESSTGRSSSIEDLVSHHSLPHERHPVIWVQRNRVILPKQRLVIMGDAHQAVAPSVFYLHFLLKFTKKGTISAISIENR